MLRSLACTCTCYTAAQAVCTPEGKGYPLFLTLFLLSDDEGIVNFRATLEQILFLRGEGELLCFLLWKDKIPLCFQSVLHDLTLKLSSLADEYFRVLSVFSWKKIEKNSEKSSDSRIDKPRGRHKRAEPPYKL